MRGNVGRVNGIDNCLLIVHGNIGGVTEVSNSIILATGNFEGATVCNDSFLQVNNQRIRFTASRDSVLINTIVKTTAPTTSRVLDTDKGPLRLLRFGPRKLDDQLTWGKEVNSLTLAITPADQKDRYQLRWKNVGKEALELSWVRFNSDFVDKNRDDLLNHVFLKGQDGKLALSRNYPPERATRAPILRRCVVLGPGQTHEETIDLWAYVDRPAADGRYQLSVELDLPNGGRGRELDVKSWSGNIQSNVLDVTLGK